MPKRALRFGVRNAANLRAATWTLWTHSGRGDHDVYLACRAVGGALKASMHQSANWHVGLAPAFVKAQFDPDHPRQKNRFIDKWARPAESEPGVSLAYRLLVPTSGVLVPIEAFLPPSIIWIPAAPPGMAVEILMVLTRDEQVAADWMSRAGPTLRRIGELGLDNLERVLVVSREIAAPQVAMPSGEFTLLRSASAADLSAGGMRAILALIGDDGSRYLLDCAVGDGP